MGDAQAPEVEAESRSVQMEVAQEAALKRDEDIEGKKFRSYRTRERQANFIESCTE
jgi:hypothetical protein